MTAFFFHLRDAHGNADDHGGLDQTQAVDGLAHEIGDHFAGDVKIRDDPVLHGADGSDALRRAAQKFLGSGAHGQNGVFLHVNGDHRRLINHNAVGPGIEQGVGRAQIHGNVFGKKAKKTLQEHTYSSLRGGMGAVSGS